MGHLCGPLDAHIRTIEAALEVTIAHRFEQFKIDGPKAKATQALEVLQALYEMARQPIPEEQVQLMLAGDTALTKAPDGTTMLTTRRADLRARTHNQGQYLDNIAAHDITFGIGPAGTGKTYLAVACAVDALERSAVQRIVLTRPAVEAGERLGFLPGDMNQKIDPYLRPLYDALYELMGFERVQKAFERQQIEVAPLGFMRGRTLNHAFIILDEAQNTTPEQMKMFLTRIGFGSKAVVTGDVSQIDLPRTQLSGLVDAERVLKRVKGIAITRLTSADVVRHPLVARIVDAYDQQRGSDAESVEVLGSRKPATRKSGSTTSMKKEKSKPVAANELDLSLQFGEFQDLALHRAALPRSAVKRWITQALQSDAELTVRVVGEEEAQTLNRDYRQKDYATNVLTFDYTQEPVVTADLVLCGPVVAREAVAQSKTLQAHYAHLLVHATLHAQGFDHETNERDALEMEALEILLLASMGYDNPY